MDRRKCIENAHAFSALYNHSAAINLDYSDKRNEFIDKILSIDGILDSKPRKKKFLSSTSLLMGTTCGLSAKTNVMQKSRVQSLLSVNEYSNKELKEIAYYSCSNVDHSLLVFILSNISLDETSIKPTRNFLHDEENVLESFISNYYILISRIKEKFQPGFGEGVERTENDIMNPYYVLFR